MAVHQKGTVFDFDPMICGKRPQVCLLPLWLLRIVEGLHARREISNLHHVTGWN